VNVASGVAAGVYFCAWKIGSRFREANEKPVHDAQQCALAPGDPKNYARVGDPDDKPTALLTANLIHEFERRQIETC